MSVRKASRVYESVRKGLFGGLSLAETAELVGISLATVKRDWTFARAWLLERMS